MCIALCVFCTVLQKAQSQPADKIIEQMEKEGCAVLESKIQVCKYDYSVNGKVLEAISFRLTGSGPFLVCCSSPVINGLPRTIDSTLPGVPQNMRDETGGMTKRCGSAPRYCRWND